MDFHTLFFDIFIFLSPTLYFCGTFALRDQDFKIIYVPITQPSNTCQYLLGRQAVVRSLKVCHLAILMPLEENPYIVPQLKALIGGKNFGVGRGVAVL